MVDFAHQAKDVEQLALVAGAVTEVGGDGCGDRIGIVQHHRFECLQVGPAHRVRRIALAGEGGPLAGEYLAHLLDGRPDLFNRHERNSE